MSKTNSEFSRIVFFLTLIFLVFPAALKADNSSKSDSAPGSIQVGTPSSLSSSPSQQPGFSDADWDPFDEMQKMERSMNRIFQETVKRMKNYQKAGEFFEPDLDMQEKPDAYIVKMDLPGMDKAGIQVDVQDTTLTISGERHTEREEQNDKNGVYQFERSSGSFRRSISLPADAKTEGIGAKYDKGVLELTIPRLQNPKSEKATRIQVQ